MIDEKDPIDGGSGPGPGPGTGGTQPPGGGTGTTTHPSLGHLPSVGNQPPLPTTPPPRGRPSLPPPPPPVPVTGRQGGRGRDPIKPVLEPRPLIPPTVATERTAMLERRKVTINETAENKERPIIFGRPEPQGGDWIYGPFSFNNDTITYRVSAHGEGPFQKITPRANGVDMSFIDAPVAGCRHYLGGAGGVSGFVEAWSYHGIGAAFQETLSGLQGWDNTFITTNSNKFDYLGFTVIKETFVKGVNESGVNDWRFVYEGYADVLDTRTGTRGYTENRALWIRELLSNTRWGGCVPTATGFADSTWSEAADDCDFEIIPLATWTAMASPKPTTNKRFTGGGIAIRQEADARDWLNTLRAECLGVLSWQSGKWSFFIQKPLPGGYVPEKFSEFHGITASGRPNVDPDSVDWSRKRSRTIPNEVQIKFPDLQNGWAMNDVVKSRPEVLSGAVIPRRAVFNLFVPDTSFAGRLAQQMLNMLWDDADFSWKADRTALRSLPFDVVALYGGGLNGQLVRLRSLKGDGEDFAMQGSEYNPASLSDAIPAGDMPLAIGTPSGANPYLPLPAPVGGPTFTLLLDTQNGIVIPSVQIDWTPYSGKYYGGTVVKYSITGGVTDSKVGVPLAGPVVIPVPQGFGKTITVKLSTLNQTTGVIGPEVSASYAIKSVTVSSDHRTIGYDWAGVLNPPVQLTTFSAQKRNTSSTVTWTMQKLDGTPITASTYLSATTGDSVTMSAAAFDAARGATEGVTVIGTVTDGVTMGDRVSVVRLLAGTSVGPVIAPPSAMAAIGSRMLVGGAVTKLAADLPTGATSIAVEDSVLASGDRIVLQAVRGGVQQTEYIAVTSGASGAGPYTYSVTRNLDSSGADAWKAGDAVVDLGQAGSGFIDVYSVRGLKSSSEHGPAIVGNLRNSGTFDDWDPRWLVGNLNGKYGYTTDIFGAAFGVPAGAWLKIDPSNGIRIGFDTTTKVQIDASGAATFSGAITAPSGAIGGWTISAHALTGGGIVLADGGFIYVGGGGFASAGTPFYVDGAGQFSLKDRLVWDGANLIINSGNISIIDGSGSIQGAIQYLSGIGSVSFVGPGGSLSFVGTTAEFDSSTVSVIHNLQVGVAVKASAYKVGADRVVGSRGAAVAHASDPTDGVARLNDLIDRLSASTGGHGLIA